MPDKVSRTESQTTDLQSVARTTIGRPSLGSVDERASSAISRRVARDDVVIGSTRSFLRPPTVMECAANGGLEAGR